MPRNLNVLIPMAGKGKRFRNAGYETYKPFVPIMGKPMIQYVLDAFPARVVKRIIADPSLLEPGQLEWLQHRPDVEVHSVSSHALGPAFSIREARAQLPLDESFFIAYCDIFWTWDFEAIEEQLDADGIVFTRRRFHPHLVGNNYSAFCKPDPDNAARLLEIREKGSFTKDWMTEPLSIGAFYAQSGHAMMAAIDDMVDADRRVSNEFFPSLLFNDLVRAGGEVRLVDVDFFVHWGVPDQLEDLLHWVDTVRRVDVPRRPEPGSVSVCCMGGAGERMKAYGDGPKALLPVAEEEPMFRYVARRFACESNFFIVSETLSPAIGKHGVADREIIDIGPTTNSQLATLEKASGFLRDRSGFLLTSCDAFGVWDDAELRTFLEDERPKAVIFTFEPTLLQEALAGNHTYVEVEDRLVRAVHIKHRPDEHALGLAGFFWFDDGRVFTELDKIPADPEHELCADHVLKDMVDRGLRVAAFPLSAYVHLGSPAELEEFAFWREYEGVFPRRPAEREVPTP